MTLEGYDAWVSPSRHRIHWSTAGVVARCGVRLAGYERLVDTDDIDEACLAPECERCDQLLPVTD